MCSENFYGNFVFVIKLSGNFSLLNFTLSAFSASLESGMACQARDSSYLERFRLPHLAYRRLPPRIARTLKPAISKQNELIQIVFITLLHTSFAPWITRNHWRYYFNFLRYLIRLFTPTKAFNSPSNIAQTNWKEVQISS